MFLKHLTVVVRINIIATSTQTSVKQPYALNYKKNFVLYTHRCLCKKKKSFLCPVII